MANLPDGRILTFASNERNAWPNSKSDEYTHAAVWDPTTGGIKSVPHPSHDMFCAAIVTLESGETFVMGGRNGAESPWVSYYDFHGDRWVQFDSSADMNRGRWYPTAVYLGSGEVFVAAGVGGGVHPEIWSEDSGWTLLSGIDLSVPILSYGYRDGAGNWPLMQLAPDGSIFNHGAVPTMSRIDPFGGPGGLGTLTDLGPHDFGWFPDEGISVTYDEGRILVAGGSTSSVDATSSDDVYLIDINGPAPALTPGTPMNYPRQFMNEVLLPNGDVVAIGGNTNGAKFDDDFAIRNAESWDPETGQWTLMNAQDQARTYHSTALLLFDGTVLSAGGGLNGEPCPGTGAPGECGVDHWNAEIFSPPYLFASDGSPAVRPEIQSAPDVARVGLTLTVYATPGLTSFSLIRMSGTTHTMNTDQRFLRPSVVETSPGTYALTLHTNEHVLVPGYWMLFALDGDVPSIAHPIQIVNDGTPRGPPIEGRQNDVGDSVLFEVELEDPDGNPISYVATSLPPGLSLDPATGIISGTTTTAGLFNVELVANDGTEAVEIDFPWIVSLVRSEASTLILSPFGWNTIDLAHHYENPVVIAGPASSTDADPVTVRVRNVTSTSFEVRVEEWPYLTDGIHSAETISYVVVEAGEYTLPGGGVLVAGIAPGIDYLNPWHQDFTPGAFTTAPSVLTQVGTTIAGAGSPPSTARVDGVSTAGFTVRIQEQEADDQNVPAEDVHWIAVEPTAVPGLAESAIAAQPIDENVASIDFTQGFSVRPHLFASLQTAIDLETATLRIQNLSAAGFGIRAQEEASLDAEVDHAPETLGWLAIDPAAASLGLLPLYNQPPTIAPPADQLLLRGDVVSLPIPAVDPEGGTLSFSAVDLPPGLVIDSMTGEVSGTLLAAGVFVSTLSVADPSGAEASGVVVWTVDESLGIIRSATPPRLVGTAIDFTAQTTLTGSFEYEWSFGDGSPVTGPLASPSTQHTFAAPGRYVVTLTVTDPATSESDMQQFVQVITGVPTTDAPRATSTIVYEGGAERVWVVNPDQDTVSVIETVTHTLEAEIPVPTGPRTLALAGDGRIWVACKEAATIAVIDPISLGVVDSFAFQAGSGPHGITFDPSGSVAFVAFEASGELLRLDGATGAVLATRPLGRDIRDLAITADGSTLYAPRFVTSPLPGEAAGVPVTEVGGVAVGGEVLVLDATTLAPTTPITLAVSTTPDSAVAARGVPNYLRAPAISPDGVDVLVPSKQDNVYRGGFRDGQPLTHDQTVRAITSRIDVASGLEDLSSRVDHDDSSVTSAVIYGSFGAYAFAALEGSREIGIVDPFDFTELGRVAVGRAPHGMVVSGDGRTLYVDNFMDRSLSVFDLGDLLDYDDPVLPLTITVDKIGSELLAPDVLIGKQLFYDAEDDRLAAQNYLSCAACHAEGGHDGRIWDFHDLGEGLRNTIGLRGHGVGMGPLHWSANFDEFQDFEGQIRHFGGSGLMTPTDFAATADPLGPPKAGLSASLDALSAYLESLTDTGASPDRRSDGGLTAGAVAGRTLFEQEGCGGCHAGPEFTDSDQGVTHDVGTLAPTSGPQIALDTPTLRGLWQTAPYLHDGSASTVADAIAAHAGVTLSPVQRVVVADYLLQIDESELAPPNSSPEVVITSPADDGTATQGTIVDLVATADDPEEGDLSAGIAWSSDLDGSLGAGGSLASSTLSLGVHTIVATVSDGLGLSGEDQVTLTIVANAPPVVAVVEPVGLLEVPHGTPVDLVAAASDPEDGDLGGVVVWTSSLDGAIGTGAQVVATALSPGSHDITVEATDSLGASSTDQTQVSVPEPETLISLVLGSLFLGLLALRGRSPARSLPSTRPGGRSE